MLAEEAAPEQELARQRLGAAQVAVRFDPHAAHRLPAALLHPRLDGLEELGAVLAHEVIQLRLALAEVIIGELLHVAQHIGEGARGFLAGLGERPQPGHVDVGMPAGMDGHIQRGACLGNARPSRHPRAGGTLA